MSLLEFIKICFRIHPALAMTGFATKTTLMYDTNLMSYLSY